MKKLVFLISIIIIMSFSVSIGLFNMLTNPSGNNILAEGNSENDVTNVETTTEETTEYAYDPKVIEIVNSMSVDEKINQLFFITPEALTGVGTATVAGNTTKQSLINHPVGGIIYFAQNLQNSAQTKALISKTKAMGDEICKVPLFIGIDEEGGKVARLGNSTTINVPKFSNMAEIGKSADNTKAYEVGKTIGTYLKEYGFNLDFAPVADVLTNSENQVVKERSFGSNPNICSDMTYQVSKGLNDLGILSCYKHFPGHGATASDTHEGFAFTDKTYEEMEKDELVPFINAIKNNADFIMVGHISAPKVIGDNTPSSISS
ncbi:MAG: glycoside hydrolase family 3 N-terminal domain-containing protein, partial [Lachnospirales bacterium]